MPEFLWIWNKCIGGGGHKHHTLGKKFIGTQCWPKNASVLFDPGFIEEILYSPLRQRINYNLVLSSHFWFTTTPFQAENTQKWLAFPFLCSCSAILQLAQGQGGWRCFLATSSSTENEYRVDQWSHIYKGRGNSAGNTTCSWILRVPASFSYCLCLTLGSELGNYPYDGREIEGLGVPLKSSKGEEHLCCASLFMFPLLSYLMLRFKETKRYFSQEVCPPILRGSRRREKIAGKWNKTG